MSRLTSGTVSGSRSAWRRAGSAPPGSALFGAALGVASDHGEVGQGEVGQGEVGQGEHGQGDVAVPADPGPHLIVVQAHLALGLLEQALNRPARARDAHQLGQGGPARRMGEVERDWD